MRNNYNSIQQFPQSKANDTDNMSSNSIHNIIHIDNEYETKSPYRSTSNLPGLISSKSHQYYLIEVTTSGQVLRKNLTAREILFNLESEIAIIKDFISQDVPKVSKLKSRDIRSLDPLSNKDTFIIIRKHAVLMCFYYYRAIVTNSNIILMCPIGGDNLLKQFSEKIVEWSSFKVDSEVSFESYCYEVLITMGFESIKNDYLDVKNQAIMLLCQFKKTAILDINTQECLRLIKNKIATILSLCNACRSALTELLDEEEDIAFMALTLLKHEPILFTIPSKKLLEEKEELISLFESYLDDYNSLFSQIEYISCEIQNAEELIMLRLDVSRNALLVADTKLSVVSVGIAIGSFVSAMFGMNLKNNWETNDFGFLIVCLVTTVFSIIIMIGTIIHFQRTNIIPK